MASAEPAVFNFLLESGAFSNEFTNSSRSTECGDREGIERKRRQGMRLRFCVHQDKKLYDYTSSPYILWFLFFSLCTKGTLVITGAELKFYCKRLSILL